MNNFILNKIIALSAMLDIGGYAMGDLWKVFVTISNIQFRIGKI
jgi:hypothetical protein